MQMSAYSNDNATTLDDSSHQVAALISACVKRRAKGLNQLIRRHASSVGEGQLITCGIRGQNQHMGQKTCLGLQVTKLQI